MANIIFCSVILYSVGGSYSAFDCDFFDAHPVDATHDDTVVNTLTCSTTMAKYSFITEDSRELEIRIDCNASDTGEVHSYIDSLNSTNSWMGIVNYSSLQPSLPTNHLPEGSACQLYGCALSRDDTTYWKIEGERCNISHPVDCILWGEWSTCYSSEHCGIGWKNRTRKANHSFFCETHAPLIEHKKCYNPCSSFHLQAVQIIAISVVLLTLLIILLLCCLLTWIGLRYCMSRHYRGLLHCINVNENEIFDAHSELVNIGTDSSMANAVAVHGSLSSLDLIEPLGKSDEFNFVDIRETYNQKACINNGREELFFPPELQFPHISTTIQDSENVGLYSTTTFNHKMVLTNVSTDGYVHTQLLSCTKVSC